MGGRVALEMLARAPERIERFALLDTGFEGVAPGAAGERERGGRMALLGIARERGMRAMGAAWARGMVHPDRLDDAALMSAILDMIERATPDQFAAQINALLGRPDRTALLATIDVPTLVLCGHDDTWSNLARHRVLARHIPGSVLVDVPHCGHMSTMERPAELNEALLAWLTDSPQPHAIPP
jgi:pimeloyl-ACP methyl ester carboxylesterase